MERVLKMPYADAPGWFAGHAAARAESYALLAALLERTPAEDLLYLLRNLQGDESLPESMGRAVSALRKAAQDHSPEMVEEEFERLFIGLGSGELIPYASWYLEKRIQSTPLASLRSDLIEWGITRQVDCREPEDHAGVLCEIMAIISRMPDGWSPAAEERFFHRHVAPWMMAFFRDLQKAKNAEFYRPVGMFGSAFLTTESEYLNRVPAPPKPSGGFHHEHRSNR